MDVIRWILILIITVLLTVFFIGQFGDFDAGGFTIFIAIGILILVFGIVTYSVMYSTHKAEEKIQEIKQNRKLEKEELWKSNDESTKDTMNNSKKLENILMWSNAFEDTTDSMKDVIKDFFMEDDIDFYKYAENEKANELCIHSSGLKYWEMANKLSGYDETEQINCTPTFREFYADNPMDRAPGIHAV